MTVVLLGDGEYEEFDLLAREIETRGSEWVLWDLGDWPSETPVTFDVGAETVTVDEAVSVEDVTGVFPWPQQLYRPIQPRFHEDVEDHGLEQVSRTLDAWRGMFASLLPLFERHGATVFFPPRTHHYHETKPLQLREFSAAGVPVPETLFTNDERRLRTFVEEHGEVVYKPIVGNAKPGRLTADDLSSAPLQRLTNAPVQFQEFVPGDDVRAYFLDGELVGASRYVTDAWSFKRLSTDPDDAEPVALPTRARTAVERAADVSPLRFGAADLRLSRDDFKLLEVNPHPRFAFHDRNGATDVAGVLADALV